MTSLIGEIVYFKSDGTVGLPDAYSNREKFIRWTGRKLHIRRMAGFAERVPAGIYMSDGRLAVSGNIGFVNGIASMSNVVTIKVPKEIK